MQTKNFLVATFIGFLILGLVGCSGADGKFARVEGTITYKGEPVEGASVTFMANDPGGTSASGMTDAAGKYSFTSSGASGGGSGALPGEYTVVITKTETTYKKHPDEEAHDRGEITYEELQRRKANWPPTAGSQAIRKEFLPEKYSFGSQLRATVKSGRNLGVNFDLTD